MKIKKFNEFLFCGGYPVLTVLIYLVLGFAFGWWHPGWLLFLTIPCYYMLSLFFEGGCREWELFPYPILCLILFLTTGFDYNLWHPMWLIFLTIPLYYLAAVFLWNNK